MPAGWKFDAPLPAVPPLHPRRGPHDPTAGSPVRAPGSVRRTVTVDMIRPDGIFGRVVLVGQGRDLVTGVDGTARVLATAAIRVEVDFMEQRLVTGIETTPPVPALGRLVGVRAASGFRTAVTKAAPELAATQSLLYALLDDVPVATLVSGYAVGRAGARPSGPGTAVGKADLCSGWRTGGTIMVGIETDGAPPVVTGPPALSLLRADDPLAWPAMEPLPPHGMRRHRRLDVVPGRDPGDPLTVDVLFRDSHQADGGAETAIHEYTVAAAVDPGSMRFTEVTAGPRALPWVECPLAAASAPGLVGTPAAEARQRVSASFKGVPTCTHLNDTLRSLADIPALAALLPAPAAG